jgi:hypothetical protein
VLNAKRISKPARSALFLLLCLVAVLMPRPADAKTTCNINLGGGMPCTVELLAIDGSEQARITFLEFEWKGELTDQYRRITVRVENTGDEPFAVDPARFLDLDDGEGFAYRGSTEPIDELPASGEPLPVVDLQPGDIVEGDIWFRATNVTWMFYYETDDGRLVPLAVHSVGGGGAGLRPSNRIGRGRG